jgi:excinuclease ABC subunit C
MPIRDLKDQIARLPEQPGVYLYFNHAGETIYVGKARSLRDRVRSYLGAFGMSPKTDALLYDADRLEVIVTDSVVEALALENHLIKQRAPRYNILLRDDKNYPYLQLTTSEAFPRVLVARRVEKDGNYYAGPFIPASLGRKTTDLTHRLFGLRSCNEVITGQRPRPCLEYDIKRCLAPCVAAICSAEEYARGVTDARLFLEGRSEELLDDLRTRMGEAAGAERFEQAAQLRDAMKTIQTLRDRQQKMVTLRQGDRDAFGVKVGGAGAVVQIFQVRRGRVVDRVELASAAADLPGVPADTALAASGSASAVAAHAAEADVLEAALQQFYEEHDPPPEVHLPIDLEDAEPIEAWLSERAGRKVKLVVPRRGEKRGLLELAARNASLAYDSRTNGQTASYDALDGLRVALKLPALPRRIECFDISTIQGAETVASMVVCEDGRMKRSDYRKFRVRGDRGAGLGSGRGAAATAADASSPEGGVPRGLQPGERFLNDFASMFEVVLRRYRKLAESGGPFPDLIVIDGGKGQLSSAYDALRAIGLERLVAIGLAKQEELVFTRDSPDAIAFPHESSTLRLLQRIRDEAHRFAITFHRKRRTMRDLRSELDTIPGIGPRRRRTLLTRFGSLAGVRRATKEELTSAVGAKAADAVLGYFAGH